MASSPHGKGTTTPLVLPASRPALQSNWSGVALSTPVSPSTTPRPIASVLSALATQPAAASDDGASAGPGEQPQAPSLSPSARRRAGFLGPLDPNTQPLNTDRLSPSLAKPLHTDRLSPSFARPAKPASSVDAAATRVDAFSEAFDEPEPPLSPYAKQSPLKPEDGGLQAGTSGQTQEETPATEVTHLTLTPREAIFNKLEDVLSGGCASARESSALADSSDVLVRPGVKVPKLSLSAVRASMCSLTSVESATDAQSELSSAIPTPRYQPEYVSKLEATNVELKHRVLALETELQRALRQEKQQNFEEDSMLMDILGSSAELHHTIRRMERLAKAGATLGVPPADKSILAKGSPQKRDPAAAENENPQVLPAQERMRYENEIAELREISEAMLKELDRRIQGVERAEEEAFMWQHRADALQRRLADSDQEYKRLEGRLTSGLGQLRTQHQQEIAQLTEENAQLRRKIIEVCDEMEATKRQEQILLECLKEVTSSFRAIGGQEVEHLREELNVGQVPPVVHKALLKANVEEANSIAVCLDDLMAQACILQRYLDIVSGDLNAAHHTKDRYFEALRDTNAALLSIVGQSIDWPVEQSAQEASYDKVITSIDTCLANIRAHAHKIWYSADEAEHRVASLEESFGALTTIMKVRAMTHSGLLERINVISGQQHQLMSLKTKTISAENERLQKSIDAHHATICSLESDLQVLTEERLILANAAESCKVELSKAQRLGDERLDNIRRLEIEAKELTVEKEFLAAELRALKTHHAQLALQLEKQVFEAGRSAEYEALVRTITSLEFSVETFLDDIEGSLQKVRSHQLSHGRELNERSWKIATLEMEMKGLKIELHDKLAAEEQARTIQSTVSSLNLKVIGLEKENCELQERLRAQRARDSENSLKEQQLQVQIAVLQGIKDTRVAEQAASESRVKLLEERNAQLLTDATTAQRQLTDFRESTEVKEREHQQETKVLAQQVVDQEIEIKKLRNENSALGLDIKIAKQDFNSAFAATMERERVLKEHVDQVCRERDELRSISGPCRQARDQGLEMLARSELLLAEVVEVCQIMNAYCAESFNNEDSSMKQLAVANKNISDLHGNQQYLQQLYEARGNELQRLQDELEGFRSNGNMQLQIAMTDLTRYERTEASLKEALRRKEADILGMESNANELRNAMQELMAELKSEREHQLMKSEAAAADISRLETSEASLLESLEEKIRETGRLHEQIQVLEAAAGRAPNESTLRTTLSEMNEALAAKTHEVFDLTRANMVSESRIADLQRKLADAMMNVTKDFNGNVELQKQLRAANEQLLSGNCELESVSEQLKNAQADLNKLNSDMQAKDKALAKLNLKNEGLQSEVKIMREKIDSSQKMEQTIAQMDAELSELRPGKDRLHAKEEELIKAKEDSRTMKQLLEDMQQRMMHSEKELQGLQEKIESSQKMEQTIAQMDAELSELRPWKDRLHAKEEELMKAKEDSQTMKQLLEDMQQRMMHSEKELLVVQALQSESQSRLGVEDKLREENCKIEQEKARLEDDLQNLTNAHNATQNELKDTQAALFESQVACNKFELKSSALAAEVHELHQQLQLGTTEHRKMYGRAASQGSRVPSAPLISPEQKHEYVKDDEAAVDPSQQYSVERVGKMQVTRSKAPMASRTNADHPAPPSSSAVASPRPTLGRPKSLDSVQSEPPPCLPPAPPPLPLPPTRASWDPFSPTSSPLAQSSQNELGGDASTEIQNGPQVKIEQISDGGMTSRPSQHIVNTTHVPDICMDLNVQNEEVGDEQSFPPVSMPPMRPPRDISASVTPRPMAPNRDASVSVRSWMSPRIVQPEIAGIGLVLTEGDWSDGKPAIVVLDLIPGTPAHTAVEIGARILEVDGVRIRGLSLEDIRSKISGVPGSRVSVKYQTLDHRTVDVMLTRTPPVASSSVGNSGKVSSLRHGAGVPTPWVAERPWSPAKAFTMQSDPGVHHQPSPGGQSPAHMRPRETQPDLGPLQQVLSHRSTSKPTPSKPASTSSPPGKIKNLILM